MDEKEGLLAALSEEFRRWEELLTSMSEHQITAPCVPSHWSTKDVIAHLVAWQQVSNTRLDAAIEERDPILPTWLGGLDPESENHLEELNARIYEAHHGEAWPALHRTWREGFLRLLESRRAISAEEMADVQRYPWLRGYALCAVLKGSLEHHRDHFDALLAWLQHRQPTEADTSAEHPGRG